MKPPMIVWTRADGTVTRVPVDLLARHISTECSFVRYYDAAETVQDGRIHPQDWALPALLQAPWQAADPYVRILEIPDGEDTTNWQAIEQRLVEVDPEWCLEDSCRDEYEPAVRELVRRTMRTPWVKAAVATKLLHKKRPNLIPVVDREVWGYYRPVEARNTHPLAPQVCDVIFGPFAQDLTDTGNQAALDELQRLLGEHEYLPVISRVRLLEMTVWLVQVRPSKIGLSA